MVVSHVSQDCVPAYVSITVRANNSGRPAFGPYVRVHGARGITRIDYPPGPPPPDVANAEAFTGDGRAEPDSHRPHSSLAMAHR